MKCRFLILCALLMALASLWGGQGLGSPTEPVLVPLPQKLEPAKGAFELNSSTAIAADAASSDVAAYLAQALRSSTGFKLKSAPAPAKNVRKNAITLSTDPAASIPAEGYVLDVSGRSAVIKASGPAGLFYGVQTLLQLLPPEVYRKELTAGFAWTIPAVHIEDVPRFKWRGLLVDVARHFWTREEIKRVIDSMAIHKQNMLQLHLTDDVGWRVELKQFPRLTEIGGWRKDIGFGLDPKSSKAYGPDGRYGGFYTQAEIREILRHAQNRFVTIVPEIEMPGHAGAALAAYPELSCSGQRRSTDGGPMGIFCPGQEASFSFLQQVLSEVMELFPSKYIHIGGDEVAKDNWKACARCQERMKKEGLKNEHELQSYFVQRIEKFINSKGRTLVGWSEIREGGLAKNAVVMDWIGGGLEAANEGHDVVMTPTTHCYLDYYQSEDRAKEPKAIGGFLPLDKVYSLEPVPAKLDPKLQPHILGLQGNLWTEYIASFRHLEYMQYPRSCALAEIGWSPQALRSYKDFIRRLETHLRRLDAMGVNYRKGFPPAPAD